MGKQTVQAGEQLVAELCPGDPQPFQKADLFRADGRGRAAVCVMKVNCQAMTAVIQMRIISLPQRIQEASLHFRIGERDSDVHGKPGRIGKCACQEGGQPPASVGHGGEYAVIVIKRKGDVKSVAVSDRVKMRQRTLRRRNDSVGIVDTYLRACVDAVLAFPEFDQPGSAAIIEIDGKGVEDHMQGKGSLIEKRGVACLALPGVVAGGDYILSAAVVIAEGSEQFLQKLTLFLAVHAADFLDGTASANQCNYRKNKQDKE